MPPNATDYISQLRALVELEFLPQQGVLQPFRDLFGIEAEDDEAEGARQEEGADGEIADPFALPASKSGVVNMGFMLVILLMNILSTIAASLAVRICKCSQKCHERLTKIKQDIFWNSWLRFGIESYLEITMGTLYGLAQSNFSDGLNLANSLVNISLLICVLAFPILSAILVHRNRDKLEALDGKIGSLYLEIRV